ncbi:TIGR03086 family metal-binding protein [Nocardia wallacei]|uniref:TIGR03086 family metal-binding protein n=1 Tax=Nocardia wallacei TaxID=480035 RepID=UPI002453D9DE|nr:TIGR03086 family metal-binding protein [Nocardia wallacei]
MTELLRWDAMALALIGHDVTVLDDADLDRPTPCTGWTVADLIRHMNERHEAIIETVLAPLADPGDDPRDSFARTAGRWVAAMEQTGDIVRLPWLGPMPTEEVLSIHYVDMLVHRWDLTRALDRTYWIPERFTARALPIAQRITAPGSRLNAPGGAYHTPLPQDPALPTIDNIVALLGRNPNWQPTTPAMPQPPTTQPTAAR